jgi:hypothetical protein
MIRIWACFVLILVLAFDARSQGDDWHQIASIAVENLDKISMDNRENIFYSDVGGNVVKLSTTGEVLDQYSPILQAKLDQLEAFWTVNIFLFSADLQQYVILDLFLNPISTQPVPQEKMGMVRAATLGNNHILWLFDEINFSLMQYDYRRNVLLQELPFAMIFGHGNIEVTEILERQNLVFVNIKDKGVFVFDNQGNLLQKLDLLITQKLNVYEDSLYFIKDGYIHRVQFFSGKEDTFQLPDPSFRNILVSAHTVVFYSSSYIHVYDGIIRAKKIKY